jgi:hypothetical protein
MKDGVPISKSDDLLSRPFLRSSECGAILPSISVWKSTIRQIAISSILRRNSSVLRLGMSRSADSTPSRRAAESKFPHRIDIPVPIGSLGNRLTEMLMWCRLNVAAGTWAQHGHSERPNARAMPAVSARFYFADEAAAQAFRKRWKAL